ncbi:aminoacyl-tRNA hydrolase [Anseongella ginsenosidimutans]|nr:aminoacyl-tRNA hydrolase [Anseongella ginsenosidimutans]QEC52482.1 aminoacyl-tRNA hydrolase [Anseongella ginsenosidimutans]
MKYLIAGLGNIGPEYADTRHNIGFMVLDELARLHGAAFGPDRHAWYTEVRVKGRVLHLIKPTTYMNLSGKAVKYWLQTLNIPMENMLVVLDDVALPFGAVRLRPKGGDAGHNGLKHINLMLGSTGYPRLRFGIGDNYFKGQQVNYVLSGFDDDELMELPALVKRSVDMILSYATIGIELTMTQFNK